MRAVETVSDAIIAEMKDNGLTSTEMLKVIELTREKLGVKYPLQSFSMLEMLETLNSIGPLFIEREAFKLNQIIRTKHLVIEFEAEDSLHGATIRSIEFANIKSEIINLDENFKNEIIKKIENQITITEK